MIAPKDLIARLGLKRVGRDWRGKCPACGYENGFMLNMDGERALWWCASCRDQEAITAALRAGGVLPTTDQVSPKPAPDTHDKRIVARQLWERAQDARGSLVETYLKGRKLLLPPGAPIRYLSGGKHPSGARLPTMISAVMDVNGKICAVHRTFLADGGLGKASVEPQRMTFGAVRGGAIRLHPADDVLVLAEGIETALAAAILLKMPAWSAVSAGNLRDTLELPKAIRNIVIAADNDAPGIAAAKGAAARLRQQGRTVRIAVPDRPGQDFADIVADEVAHG